MRRREQIWNTYKDNPNFRMYDVYHWEAHPSTKYPEPTTLPQRVTHYEAYLDIFPQVVWPGLVEEPISDPLSETFGLFNDYWGDQTYLVLIDAQGKIAYQNSFPLGCNNISTVYNDIDALLPSLMAQTAVTQNIGKAQIMTIDIVRNNSFISFNLSKKENVKITIHTISGKKILSKITKNGRFEFNIKNLSSGSYLFSAETTNGTISKSFIID